MDKVFGGNSRLWRHLCPTIPKTTGTENSRERSHSLMWQKGLLPSAHLPKCWTARLRPTENASDSSFARWTSGISRSEYSLLQVHDRVSEHPFHLNDNWDFAVAHKRYRSLKPTGKMQKVSCDPKLREVWKQTTIQQEQMGSLTLFRSTIHRGGDCCCTHRIWLHFTPWIFINASRQCDERWGQRSIEHMWLDADQIIIGALIDHQLVSQDIPVNSQMWNFLQIRSLSAHGSKRHPCTSAFTKQLSDEWRSPGNRCGWIVYLLDFLPWPGFGFKSLLTHFYCSEFFLFSFLYFHGKILNSFPGLGDFSARRR